MLLFPGAIIFTESSCTRIPGRSIALYSVSLKDASLVNRNALRGIYGGAGCTIRLQDVMKGSATSRFNMLTIAAADSGDLDPGTVILTSGAPAVPGGMVKKENACCPPLSTG